MAAAAPDGGPVAEMESLLTCSICLETLKEPRTLGCFHSFCKCCLQKDVKRQREMEEGKVIDTFDCPLCRTQFSLKQGEKVEGMLPNHFIGNMLEVLEIQLRAKELPCFFCGSQRPAVSRCTTCEQYLCSKCLTTHNNWPGFNEHVVLTMDELAKPENQAKARGKPRCPKHEKKTLKFYCETCKELVCTHCIVLQHAKPNHSCLPIDEVAEKQRELLRASSVILDEQHKEGNKVLQKIEANTEALKNNAKKAKDDITQQKKAILKAFTQKLEEKAALMINEVDRKYNEVYEPLTQQKTDVKAYVDKVKGSMDVAKNLLEKGSHEEVIYNQTLVGENVAKVKRERSWVIKPIHDGNIQFKAKPIVPAMDDGTILNNLGEVVCDPVTKPEPFKTPLKAKPRNINPPPRKQRNNSDKNPPQLPAIEKPIIDEIRTVIVSGICPETTYNTLQFFFENKRRSGGGDIENFKRIEPQIAHITFLSSQVALSVLKKEHLEVDGYLLKLEAKKPKVTFPTDKKKLYVENLSTKTSKDSLLNYVEVITGLEVTDVVFGKNNNATVTLNEEADMNKTKEKAKKKPLQGAALKITNPPVCNSILVTGISEETTKDSIVFKFENPKYGGGEILDVAYQQDQGKAVISYYDPDVINRIVSTEHMLNDSKLTVCRHYPFMESHDEHVAIRHQYLSEQLSKKSLTIEKESVSLLKDEKWRNFRDDLTEKFGIKLFIIENAEIEVWLTGENSQVQKAYKELKEFVKFNTIISESIVLHGIGRYLEKFSDSKMKEIEQRLKKDFVQLGKGKKEGTLFLQGTKEGVAEAKIMLQEIIFDVAHRFIPVEEPGMQKYLHTESGKIGLEGLESKHHCTITLTNNNTKQREMEKYNNGQGEKVLRAIIKNSLKQSDSLGHVSMLFLEIYADKDETIDKVAKQVEKITSDQIRKERIEEDEIENVSKADISRINKIGEENNVEVKIEKSIKHIIVRGHFEDIGTVMMKIRSILNEIKLAEQEKETAEMVAKGVQWYWIDTDGSQIEYDVSLNSKIEKAFIKEKASVTFELEEGKCEIVFDKMQETNQKTGEKTEVVRKDLKAKAYISVPDYWDPHPKDSKGKECPVHIVCLDPQNNADHSKEYKNISDGFLQTAPPNQTIQKIERIQNPSLFKLYALKKQSMDERDGSNEKFLYHGTSTAKVADINKNGLNRSYNGVNGTAFGKGIYFARDANLTAGYAKPDASGNRSMYVVRVSVGQYTQGNKTMIVPPDNYDSVVNNPTAPTIFVSFYDNQYYPEYLITFR